MSERSAFTTEYIYCGPCFELAKSVLLSDEKSLSSQVILSWIPTENGGELPIIAGKVGASFAGGEWMEIYNRLEEIAERLCHPLRVSILEDSGRHTLLTLSEGGVYMFQSSQKGEQIN